MLIEKQFSSYDDYGYEDERVYSVLMDEEELRLYSEFLEEREYGNKENKAANRNWQLEKGRELLKKRGVKEYKSDNYGYRTIKNDQYNDKNLLKTFRDSNNLGNYRYDGKPENVDRNITIKGYQRQNDYPRKNSFTKQQLHDHGYPHHLVNDMGKYYEI